MARGHHRAAPVEALRVLIDRICTPAESTTQDKVNRGLTYYNDHLAESLPREYARVLSPLHELIKDIINRGIADGSFRAGLDVDATAALIMQSALGAMRLQVLGAELNGVPVDADHIYDFCVSGLGAARPTPLTCAVPVRKELLRGRCFRWSRRGNVITTRAKRDFQEAEMTAASSPIRCSTPTTTSTSPKRR